jgi:hypothetical protein
LDYGAARCLPFCVELFLGNKTFFFSFHFLPKLSSAATSLPTGCGYLTSFLALLFLGVCLLAFNEEVDASDPFNKAQPPNPKTQ